jgi:predicted ATPase
MALEAVSEPGASMYRKLKDEMKVSVSYPKPMTRWKLRRPSMYNMASVSICVIMKAEINQTLSEIQCTSHIGNIYFKVILLILKLTSMYLM